MVEEVDVTVADFWVREVEGLVDFKGLGFFPLAFLPVAAFGGDLTDVDFWVEVGGEGEAVVTGVGINDVDSDDFIEEVFLGVGAEYVGYSGVEA